MHHRLEDGYRRRWENLLRPVWGRRTTEGVTRVLRRARGRSRREGAPVSRFLFEWHECLRRRFPHPAPPAARSFVCDASLGGLARWLRAAGYPASVSQAGGVALLAAAHASARLLLTSDSRLAAADDAAVLWVPSAHRPHEQLLLVMRDLGVAPREPLCMACGGALQAVAKESVFDRIPPRTRPWRDEYFLCASCGKLFWNGTHWERIEKRLAGARR